MEKKSIKDTGLHLLKKGQKGLVHAIFSRFGIIILLFAVQVIIFLAALIFFQSFAPQFFGGGIALGFLVSLYIINTRIDPTAKLTWVILVMALPVFGTLLFFYTTLEFGHRSLRERVENLVNSTRKKIPQEKAVLEN
ncbi:MAG: PLDc_N domain-containing protein, partial [Oscillospiraceae bacterium]|nr:PLDc_N domain-containing protein [Oscillospiraceae bacterium]